MVTDRTYVDLEVKQPCILFSARGGYTRGCLYILSESNNEFFCIKDDDGILKDITISDGKLSFTCGYHIGSGSGLFALSW